MESAIHAKRVVRLAGNAELTRRDVHGDANGRISAPSCLSIAKDGVQHRAGNFFRDIVLKPELEILLNLLGQLLEGFVALISQLHGGEGVGNHDLAKAGGLAPDRELRRQNAAPRMTEDMISYREPMPNGRGD